MKNIMKEAHRLTKEIKKEFPEVDYKTQLGICLSFLSKEGDKSMKYSFKAGNGVNVEIGINNEYRVDYLKVGDVVLTDKVVKDYSIICNTEMIVINQKLAKRVGVNAQLKIRINNDSLIEKMNEAVEYRHNEYVKLTGKTDKYYKMLAECIKDEKEYKAFITDPNSSLEN